jgi:Tol biopolymer transport system component
MESRSPSAEGDSVFPTRLYVVPSVGGTPHSLVVPHRSAARTSWANAGKSIVFSDTAEGEIRQIVIADLATSKVLPVPDSKNLEFPVCSPDGRFIAATDRDGQKLMLFGLATQKWSELIKMNVGLTEWSADGKYLYFDTGLNNDPAMYRLRIVDHKLERMVSLKGLRRQFVSYFPWNGVTPDGSPLLLRDTSSQEVYGLDFDALDCCNRLLTIRSMHYEKAPRFRRSKL